MRARVCIGLTLLVAVVAAGGCHPAARSGSSGGTPGTQALIPSYGLIRCRDGETLTLSSGLLETTVAGLFGSKDNITAVRLTGAQGPVEVLGWDVQMLASSDRVTGPAASLRNLTLNVRAPGQETTLTDIEFEFANGVKKAFPFGDLRLQPRDDTPPQEMEDKAGGLWELFTWHAVETPTSTAPGKIEALMVPLSYSLRTRPLACRLTGVDPGNPLFKVVDSSVVQVKDIQTYEAAVRAGREEDARATAGRGLPLTLALAEPPAGQVNAEVNLGFRLRCAATAQTPALAYLYFHPQLTLDVDGRTVTVAINCGYATSCVNPYSAEAAAFLQEWGR